jgi:Secretion system C-terminal sorting domain
MKKIFTLFTAACLYFGQTANSQVVLNELYTDPGNGKSEFFELYNPSASAIPASLDNYTLLCFFDISGQLGFYVMDLPNLTVTAKGYFVGSAALPFNYQGITNSTASDFSWNSAAFVTNNGYVRKWGLGTANLSDGNSYYDQGTIPANFNDFLFRRVSSGASYSVFLYRNGVLVNTFLGGVGASATMLNDIVNLPPLYIDMTGSSPDFTINFSGYGSLPIESTAANAGSDNGYIRVADGACASWVKSSSQINHTPKVTNGSLGSSNGTVSVSNAINRGTAATGSTVNYDIVGAPSTAFPIEMQIYVDNGSIVGQLDATDTYVESNTENNISQGPFYTTFFPYNASILIVVKTNAGCLDQVLFIPNSIVLSVNYIVSFEGNQVNNMTRLNWKVETNELADHFDVQKSTNGRDFTSTGIVIASGKAGSDTYSYIDAEPAAPGKIIYRLRVFQKSGKSYYSNLLLLQNKEDIKKPLAIINNPVNDRLTLSFQAGGSGQMEVKIIDMMGRLMLQEKTNIGKGTTLLSFPTNSNYKSGVYVVDLFDGTKHYTDKFVKQ